MDDGCGLQVKPTARGFLVEGVDPMPGQPDLRVDDYIVSINGASLKGEDLARNFPENKFPNAKLDILRGYHDRD